MSQSLIDEATRNGFYEVLFGRRDVRSQFLPDDIDDAVLMRILKAAHHAPSVGLSQPWDFIVLRDRGIRQAVKQAFDEANEEAASRFSGERAEHYRRLKLEGILDAPVNICVTCDRDRGGPVVLGRTHQADTDIYSTVCAIQNLWLAARAENLGVGWVSILKAERIHELLQLPASVVPIAWLCVGQVSEFLDQPELQQKAWSHRDALQQRIHFDGW